LVYYSLFWCSSIIECSHGYYGYNCSESCDGCLLDSCERENGVCTDTSGCKPRRQLGQMKKCGKDINAMFYMFFIQDEVTYQFFYKDIRAIQYNGNTSCI
jgi:hypothetical protein